MNVSEKTEYTPCSSSPITMSRQSHLPPRCPLQKTSIARPLHGSSSQHHNSPSQSSILEERPSWLDDLLGDEEPNSKETFHRRSASDSFTLLDGLADSYSGLDPQNDEESSGHETYVKLESASMYGPNSPRQRGNIAFSENAIASALSEYAFQNPLHYVDGSLQISGISHPDTNGDASGSVDEQNAESKAVKRHSGQRSRVRKLQYIAELERTVSVLQSLESELAVRVASVLQQRAALSMENSKLKQQLGRLRREKLRMEGQHRSLEKEAARLRCSLPYSPGSKVKKHFGASTLSEAAGSDATWEMVDHLARFNLN